MKHPAALALALALGLSLAACGSPKVVTVTPEEAATPAPQQRTEQQLTAAPAGEFYTVGADFNTGDAWYSLEAHQGYCLLTRTDYATATRQVLCSVPGCAHTSESCPAWLPGRGQAEFVFTAGDKVYVYRAVPTMNYQGSWEEYYAEYVAPKLKERPQGWEQLSDEEVVEYSRSRYEELSLPPCLYSIEADGASRTALDLSGKMPTDVWLQWCEGTALYGYEAEMGGYELPQGYRLSLQDGSVTTFPLMERESVQDAYGDCLLTERIVSEVPIPAMEEYEAYDAVMQNAVIELDWLNPVTGERRKVLDYPYAEKGRFFGLACGKLLMADTEEMWDGTQVIKGFSSYDPASGQWKTLVPSLPQQSTLPLHPAVKGLPAVAARQGRYLWFSGSDNVNGENLAWVLDTQSGELTAVQQTVEGELPHWAARAVAFTDDGRFLVQTALREGESGPTYDYALIDAQAFLQGSTDYTPITTVER